MKLSASNSDLSKAVQTVLPAIERKTTLPILGNLLINAAANETRITATDLELELAITVPLPAEEPGDITLPARRFYDILRALPENAPVTIATDDSKATLKSGRSRFTLQTLPVDDYPARMDKEFVADITVAQSVLHKTLVEAAYAVARQDVRHYLNGCLFDYSTGNGQITVVSTDGHRLAAKELSALIDSSEASGCAILPAQGLQALMKLIKSDLDLPVRLQLGRSHLRVQTETTQMTSILIDGTYPDYLRVIPKNPDKIVIADREQVMNVVRRANIILANDKIAGVRVTLDEWLMKVYARNSDQEEAEEELDVNYTGGSLEIGFNADYLIEALNAIPGETVKLGFTDSMSSLLLEAGDVPSGKHVIMPMRL